MSTPAGDAGALVGRVVFVTGSTRGIGWASAEAFARAGAGVVLNGRASADALQLRAADLAERFGTRVLTLLGDVADSATVGGFYKRIFGTFGRLDVLVNNAGILRQGLIGAMDDDTIDSLLRTNVAGVIRNLQAGARLIGRNPEGGAIVNLSSIVATQGSPGQSAYAATKAAVIGLTQSAARELAPKRIRVNAVAPGVIDTDMMLALKPEALEKLRGQVGLQRLGTAQDVANVVLFLASDQAAYVTGQVLGVDGGLVL